VLTPRRTDRTNPALDALGCGEFAVADPAASFVQVFDAVVLFPVVGVAEHVGVRLEGLAFPVLSPEVDPTALADESEWAVAVHIVRAVQQCHNPLSGSELRIIGLCPDLECPVVASGGILERDRSVVCSDVHCSLLRSVSFSLLHCGRRGRGVNSPQ